MNCVGLYKLLVVCEKHEFYFISLLVFYCNNRKTYFVWSLGSEISLQNPLVCLTGKGVKVLIWRNAITC